MDAKYYIKINSVGKCLSDSLSFIEPEIVSFFNVKINVSSSFFSNFSLHKEVIIHVDDNKLLNEIPDFRKFFHHSVILSCRGFQCDENILLCTLEDIACYNSDNGSDFPC